MNQFKKTYSISQYLQPFIYTMNDERVRNKLIHQAIQLSPSSTYRWIGTWTIEMDSSQQLRFRDSKKPFEQYVKRLSFENDKIYLFTVCLVYEGNKVHYVAFIYSPQLKQLLSFDPGVELYHHGQKTIVPYIRKTFYHCNWIESNQLKQRQNVGTCQDYSFCGKKWGIQYNADHRTSLPADAFCQTWTIFFLTRFMLQRSPMDMSFIHQWCKVHPNRRELFLLNFFILPQLKCCPSLEKEYISQLNIRTRLEYNNILLLLVEYTEYLFLHNSLPKITCPK